jgi:hypothetical protein
MLLLSRNSATQNPGKRVSPDDQHEKISVKKMEEKRDVISTLNYRKEENLNLI